MRLTNIEIERETLAEAMENFMLYKKAKGVEAVTMRDYERHLNCFLEFSSNTLEETTLTDEVMKYFSNIPDTSPARYNHPFQNLNAFFNWAVKKGKINNNPLVTLDLHKKKDDGNIKPATIEDVKALLKSYNQATYAGLRNYTIVMLMLDTGIRTSELRRLTDSDFDATAKQITISKHISKTRKTRIVYLSDTTAKLITKLIKVKPDGFSDLIFPTNEGKPMTCEHLSKEFAKQCKKAGVKITPYQMRHTFASYFVANGGDLFTLQDLMGHADLRMTKRYTEIDENQKKQAHNNYSPVNALQGASRLVKIG